MGARLAPRVRAALVAAVLAALVVDFVYYTGFYASDDIAYLAAAQQLATGESDPVPASMQPELSAARLGMTVPNAVVYWLTGGSPEALAWFFVLYHLALVVVAFRLGRLWGEEGVGLLAAFAVATSPILTTYAGAVLPDNPTALWLALMLLVLELARRRAAAAPLGRRAAVALYGGAGLLLGAAYSVKETGIVMVVPAAAAIVASAPRLRSSLWIRHGAFFAAGLLTFLLVELLALRAMTGEWVFRLGMAEATGDIMVERMETQGGAGPLGRLWYALDGRLLPLAPITTWMLLAGAIGYPILFRRRASLSLALFFWWPFLYLTVGSTSLTEYQPPSIQARYYAIAVVPALVMTAMVLCELFTRWRAWARPPAWSRRRAAYVALAAALVLVVVLEQRAGLSRAGRIYGASRARGFVATWERARTGYPEYPIALGGYYATRMGPLARRLDPAAVEGALPDPPFLLLESRALAAKYPVPLPPGVKVTTLEVVAPPRSRTVDLEIGVRRLVGLPPPVDPPVHAGGAGLIQLVAAPGERTAATLPLVLLRGGASLREVGGGHLVVWREPEEIVLQVPERGSIRSAPEHPGARLPEGSRRVRLSLPVRLTRGRRAALALGAYGYAADGAEAARTQQKVALAAGATPSPVALDLAADQPLATFRLRLHVDPDAAGALVLGPITVAGIP